MIFVTKLLPIMESKLNWSIEKKKPIICYYY